MTDPQLTPILQTIQREFTKSLGEQLVRLMLYGSWARGDARPDSDIDVLVVTRGEADYRDLMARTSAAVAQVSLLYDVVISRTFVSESRFASERSPFLISVRREGVAV